MEDSDCTNCTSTVFSWVEVGEYCGSDDIICNNGITTASINGKFRAKYSNSTTYSAECDSTSAITSGEITLANLVDVEIGDCVTDIGRSAFTECINLTSCTIGSGVTSIGNEAFDENIIASMTVKAIVPPTIPSSRTLGNPTVIYVPPQSLEAYKNANGWDYFDVHGDRYRPIPT